MRISRAATTNLENNIATNNIYLLSESRSNLAVCRKHFEERVKRFIEAEKLQILEDFCSHNEQLSDDMLDLKRNAFEMVKEVSVKSIMIVKPKIMSFKLSLLYT
jgi:hypothetical protein